MDNGSSRVTLHSPEYLAPASRYPEGRQLSITGVWLGSEAVALASPSPPLSPAAPWHPALRPGHPGAPGQGTKDSPWARWLRGRPCPDQQVRSNAGQSYSASECFQTLHSGRRHIFFISLRKKRKRNPRKILPNLPPGEKRRDEAPAGGRWGSAGLSSNGSRNLACEPSAGNLECIC